MPINFDKYKKTEHKIKVSWFWVLVGFIVIWNILIVTFQSNFIWGVLTVSIAWGTALLIPCIIKYGLKKTLTKRSALIYTICSFLFFTIGNIIIDDIVRAGNPQAVHSWFWSILSMIAPYYLLTDENIITPKQKDNITAISSSIIKEEPKEKEKKQEEPSKLLKNFSKLNFVENICTLYKNILTLVKSYKGLSKNATFIIIAIIIASAYIVVENNKIAYKEKIRQNDEQEIEHQRNELNACINNAEQSYSNLWDSNCKSKGLSANCSLNLQLANSIDKQREYDKKQCLEKFKSKAFD